jgi:hypothetical protein
MICVMTDISAILQRLHCSRRHDEGCAKGRRGQEARNFERVQGCMIWLGLARSVFMHDNDDMTMSL